MDDPRISLAETLLNQPGTTEEYKTKIRQYIREKLGIDPDTIALGGEYWTDERKQIYLETKKMTDDMFSDEK